MNLFANQKFKDLMPPLTDVEFDILEQNILADGVRDSICVWDGTIVDGHSRYEIAQKHNLPFATKEMSFADDDEAIEWIIKTHLGRRHLNKYKWCLLALKLKDPFVIRAKMNQGKNLSKISAKSVNVRKELAEIANVSEDTFGKVERIEKCTLPIAERLKERLANDEITVNGAIKELRIEKKKVDNRDFWEDYANRDGEDISGLVKDDGTIITNKIHRGDCLELIKKLPSESVDLIITSPPYNKGWYAQGKKVLYVDYDEFDDCIEPAQYARQQTELITECMRVLKPHGSLFYNHKAMTYNGKLVYPEYVFGFTPRQIITWDRKGSEWLGAEIFQPITEIFVWIPKSTDTDITRFCRDNAKYSKDVWRINPEQDSPHPASFPEELVSNIIVCASNEGDVVLDPYSGSGTTAMCAKKLKRNYIGFDLSKGYNNYAKQRISSIQDDVA